jgi:hypothetical protein
MPFMKRRTRVAIITQLVVLIGMLWNVLMPEAAEYISKAALLRNMKERCGINIKVLREKFRRENVKILGTNNLAANSDAMRCGLEKDDPSWALIEDENYIREIEIYIKQHGVANYVLAAKEDMRVTLDKYKYYQVLSEVEKNDATIADLKILSILWASIAATESFIKTVEDSALQGN